MYLPTKYFYYGFKTFQIIISIECAERLLFPYSNLLYVVPATAVEGLFFLLASKEGGEFLLADFQFSDSLLFLHGDGT
jgi:hypothetical protein